ncbi:FKBP-type peptidyl-prolyl cis-trans isomerase [Myroides injenensis]|uniref:FKBP-type peptidyl-prolyl cis-trans isomerase n=1 Tax=Myroides injenensis TaxID=1183151 RepID=UPI000287EB4A|nr:FKBP-type peptidyl-prolyl cis-trans isomerase [Myroides injenensis]
MGVAELLRKRKEALAKKNLEEGRLYLQEFLKNDEVISVAEGLAYLILERGNGEKAGLDDRFECSYIGRNIKGVVFDSSSKKSDATVFLLNKLIKAYQIVVPQLEMGTKFIMVASCDYAYKDQYISQEIGPNSSLIFEVELKGIIK